MRTFAIMAVITALVVQPASAATGERSIDPLMEKLLEKGVISKDDAREIEEELKQSADGQNGSEGAAKEAATGGLDIKIRAQARFDRGDLLVDSDGKYQTENDLFLRRVRLELEKGFEKLPMGRELKINLTLDADRAEQDFRDGEREDASNRVDLRYIYGDWTVVDAFAVKIGKHKLPLSRVSLTSSSRLLLIERPASTEVAKDILGDYQQAQIQIHGDVAGGALKYHVAYGDGANSLDQLQTLDGEANEVRKERWGNAYIARIELSPPGLSEKKKDDTGIGEDNHLTIGIHGGVQSEIRYSTEDVTDADLDTFLWGADLAGRYTIGTFGIVTGQGEYITFKRDFNYREDENPWGAYFQIGFLLAGTVLSGNIEPAMRYEVFDHDRIDNAGESGTKEKTLSLGFNHYISQHNVKWVYNFVHTSFDRGVAEASADRNRNLHQILLQLYF